MSARSMIVRSSWATVNLGDVAHSPGVVRALQRSVPNAEVVLWPVALGKRERAMLEQALPGVPIVDGAIASDGKPDTPELAVAIERADVLVHGSAAGLYRGDEISWWRETTCKPYGYLGVTVDPLCPPTTGTLSELERMVESLPSDYLADEDRRLLDEAEFVVARDSLSLDYLRRQGVATHELSLGADGTFGYDYLDDGAAEDLLSEFGLVVGEFACFVPRLRYAPYAQIYGSAPTREQRRRDAVNAATMSADLSALAEAISTWVHRTGQPALVVPEMSYAVAVARDQLVPLLDDAVGDRVHVLDRYWPLEQAAAVYARSSLVVSMECHSPILASISHTPTLYLRQPTETFKSQMFADLGHPEVVVELPAPAGMIESELERIIGDLATARTASRDLNHRANDALERSAHMIAQRRSPVRGENNTDLWSGAR